MGGGKKVTIGYWYGFGIHMGIGRGPIDGLTHIKVDDKEAFSGHMTTSGTVRINKRNLFGGEKREGGIDGDFTLMMGESNQVSPLPLARMLRNTLVPGFRGVVTAFYDGWVTAMNPYPKPWKFRLYRLVKGWKEFAWYPEKAQITLHSNTSDDPSVNIIRAMNPAHIIYEALTNPVWGRGFPRTTLVDSSWKPVADTLSSEEFGMCFAWRRQDSLAQFVQTVLDHIGGMLIVDRQTGTIELRLIRDDYDVENIPHYDFSNGLLKIEELESSAMDTATNSVAVSFFDPVMDEERVTAPSQNIAAIQLAGGVNATVQSYFGVPTEELASRLALRDLLLNMGTLRRAQLLFDKSVSHLVPGDVISISSQYMGIEKLVLRVGQVDTSSLTEGTIGMTCLEDQFGMPSNSFVQPTNPEWVRPDTVARNVAEYMGTELSYAAMARIMDAPSLQLIADTETFLATYGEKPEGLGLGYDLWVSANSTVLTNYTEAYSGDWTPTGVLSEDMPQSATNTLVVLEDFSNLDMVEVGHPARVDNEEFRVVAINHDTGAVTLARGCIDTVPAAHAKGARIWFYLDTEAWDDRAYLPGDTINYKMLTNTTGDVLGLAQAASRAVQAFGRQGRPYPPGNVVVAGARYPEALNGNWNFNPTWSHRDRITQADRIIDTLMGNFGPEVGTTYEVTIRGEDNTILQQATGITTTSFAYSFAAESAQLDKESYAPTGVFEVIGDDGLPVNPAMTRRGNSKLRLQLVANRGGDYSWQSHDIVVERAGWGYNFGNYFGGAI